MNNFKPHFLTLGVKSIERSRKFYEDVLNFKVSKVSGNIVFYKLGGIILGLYPESLLAEDATIPYQAPSGYRGVTISHNVFGKSDVDTWIEKLRKSGAQIVKEAEDVFWGGRSAYFKDPDEHLWEIVWNPHVSFDKDGTVTFSE